MNIYHPYEVIADTDDCLHLKESEARERTHFVMLRVLPVFLLFFGWFVLQQVGREIPMGWNYVLIIVIITIAAMLLLRSYITEIKMTDKKEIYFVQRTATGSKERTIAGSDIEKIILKRKKGKATGAFFLLCTRSKRKYWLLNIPSMYVDEHHISLIKERLQDMLGIVIEGK